MAQTEGSYTGCGSAEETKLCFQDDSGSKQISQLESKENMKIGLDRETFAGERRFVNSSLVKCVSAAMVVSLFVYSMYFMRDYIHAVLLWTELQSPYTVFTIFVLLYTLVSLPLVWGYIVVNLACGYLYGVMYGMAVTVVTATVGIAIAHFLCKHVLARHIQTCLTQTEFIRSLHTVISGPQAFKIVVLARLTPVPFGLQNAVFSVSNLTMDRYILASVLGLLPTQTLNVYIGSTLRSMEEVLTNSDNMLAGWVILLAQLLVTVLVGVFVVRSARSELDRTLKLSQSEDQKPSEIICQ